jgi:hypothetical protein
MRMPTCVGTRLLPPRPSRSSHWHRLRCLPPVAAAVEEEAKRAVVLVEVVVAAVHPAPLALPGPPASLDGAGPGAPPALLEAAAMQVRPGLQGPAGAPAPLV